VVGVVQYPGVATGGLGAVQADIGAVVTPIPGANPETLLTADDASLYYAKANGKGHWFLHNLDAPA
jgi:predicted signal transduction protein with EAL and GGDEF domain